jgi:hypothetical protein
VSSQFLPACPQRRLRLLLGQSVLVRESFESCMILGGAFCVAHRALLNCKQEARIHLRGLRWNASLMRPTFSSEVRVFPGDFTCNRLPVALSLLSRTECFSV